MPIVEAEFVADSQEDGESLITGGTGGDEVPPEGSVSEEEESGVDACEPVVSIACVHVNKDEEPWIDGWSDEWGAVEAFEIPLVRRLDSNPYPWGDGTAKVQCVHGAKRIYFMFHVPGPYRFSPRDNRLCAAMSAMFRMGDMATLSDMVR